MSGSRPLIAVSATQRPTKDWDGSNSLIQVRISAQYAEAVYQAGGIPLVIPTFSGSGGIYVSGRGWPKSPPRTLDTVRKEAYDVMSKVSGLLLTGGGDVLLADEPGAPPDREMDRDRDFWEAALLEGALKLHKPVLGVCRGLQVMNVFLGGTLWDDIPSQCPEALRHQQRTRRDEHSHSVILEPDSQIYKICGRREISVNSGHHQGVREKAQGLKITGRSGDGLIEALEYTGAPMVLGVQWHPEGLISHDPVQLALFKALVSAARSK
ncbi:MAG: gamma-glutamyl-gamma-aminobutyrate hydrolase family protein [Deltaproteobacteria bacterium]|jgi:putative glutamine amidotransferase|nr:gamma-glutamyl-gamma-aminobutyrate hydrolase family protein [Deltaproteobacteria bacterium]